MKTRLALLAAALIMAGSAFAQTRWDLPAAYSASNFHTVNLEQWDHRGSIAIPSFVADSKIPTDVLYRMGVDALPMLAEALDDETPTATVTDNRGRDKKVWQVNDVDECVKIIQQVVGKCEFIRR